MRHQLYRHFDKEGRLLYVGISLSAVARLAAHKGSAHWYDQITSVSIEQCESREALLDAEREAILAEKPLHNVVFGSARPRPKPRPVPEQPPEPYKAFPVPLIFNYSVPVLAQVFKTSEAQVDQWIDAGRLLRPGTVSHDMTPAHELVEILLDELGIEREWVGRAPAPTPKEP